MRLHHRLLRGMQRAISSSDIFNGEQRHAVNRMRQPDAAVDGAKADGAVVVWYQVKKRKPTDPSARADRSVNLDVGEIVQIEAWNPDGTANVRYRGSNWTAIHRSGVTPSAGAHRVAELVGSRLLVDKV